MYEWFVQYQPLAIETWSFWLLIFASFFTSALTASVGIGGGILLLAIMANTMPPLAVVPVHTLVQFGSNAGRLMTLKGFANWQIVLWVSLGSIVGATLGGQLVLNVPVVFLQLALAIFIFYSAWFPIFKLSSGRRSLSFLGFITSFLGMFISGTGPFIYVVLKEFFTDRRGIMATVASINVFQQSFRAALFFLLGFAFSDWIALILMMVATGFLGTLTGKYMLSRISTQRADLLLKWVLTVLSLRLLYQSVIDIL